MARIARTLTLGHRANTGEEVRSIELAEGAEVEILARWAEHVLVKNDDGLLLNVPRDAIESNGGADGDGSG